MRVRAGIVTVATLFGCIALAAVSGRGQVESGGAKPLDGVRARLAPASSTWLGGDTPRIMLDIENGGASLVRVPRCPTLVGLEIDGKTARIPGESTTPYLGALAPGRRAPRLDVDLDVLVREEEGGREVWRRLELTPGRHTIRATVTVESLEDDAAREIRTEPVEVVILAAEQSPLDRGSGGREAVTRRALARGDVPRPRLGFYLVSSRDGRRIDASTDLEDLELEAVPVLDDRDIVSYDWSTHTVELTERAVERLPSPGVFGLPFVVVAGGERCYAGAFWTPVSSILPSVPMCYPPRGWLAALSRSGRPGAMSIDPAPIGDAPDPRSDPRIRRALEELAKLR